MYDHLSRFDWLLRGEATSKRFRDFVRVKGEVFVSGDYESATDNLNHHIQELLLRKVCDQTLWVPLGVRDTAMRSLSMMLSSGDKVVVQQRGQLMGNLLSFPLLCLVNYLGFRYYIRRKVPLRINGDDIVFRGTPEEAKRWMEGVGRSGLTLSKGKTLVNNRFFSLNSRFFEAMDRQVRLVPVVRSKGLFGTGDSKVFSLRDRFRVCQEGFSSAARRIVSRQFLLSNRKAIIASRRSVRNGLGIRVSSDLLAETGLLYREMCYLCTSSVASGEARYVPEIYMSDALKPEAPYGIEGWELRRVPLTKQVKDWQREHARLVIAQSWIEPFIGELGIDEKILNERIKGIIQETGYDYSTWIHFMKRRIRVVAGLTGSSRNTLWSWLRSVYSFELPDVEKRPKCQLWYCPATERRAPIDFRSPDGLISSVSAALVPWQVPE
jgi:hypothetical protein